MKPPNPFGKHVAEIHRESRISKNTRETARHYTDKGVARKINASWRRGKRPEGRLGKVSDALDSAFERVRETEQDGTVWRALRDTELEYPAVGEYLPLQPAFTSTTLSREYARQLLDVDESGDLLEVIVRSGGLSDKVCEV